MPQFSVCVPAYNDVAAFARCLDSVLGQRGITLECIVSDDSTTDDIATRVARLADSRLVYSRNAERHGPVANWNKAIRQATGEFVTLLHQDDWYRSDHALREICAIFGREGADTLFCGRALYEDGHCLSEYPLTLERVTGFRRRFPGRSLVVNTLGHPGVAFFANRHKDVLYDTSLLYFSDTEYFYRLIGASGRVAVCAAPHIAVSRSATQLSAGCVARLDACVPQLAYALDKHNAVALESGLALARFFAANLRHWGKMNVSKAAHRAWTEFSLLVLVIMLLSFPVFFAHMLYRAAYRRVNGKVWG
ncbi:MAG: glycosyltransferase [Desulfovibrio sp.]|jgi:glycosyltransferase involved in cell wall biosynthesis|nr:glycosyltransferase [Desulfovibrio sp.]